MSFRVRMLEGIFILGCAMGAGASQAAPVAVGLRVQGLALGNSFQVRLSGALHAITVDDDYVFANAAQAGAALDLQIATQPMGQLCAVSELAPANVPADSAPVFIRCRFVPGARVTVPTTPPDDGLSVMLGASAMRAYAYPGLPYESRPGVLGGQFPYEFRLTAFKRDNVAINSDGVSVDFRRGTLRFTPTVAGSYAITMEIRDSGATQKVLTHTFTVDVGTANFIFVANNGVDATTRGAIAQPMQTITYALAHGQPQQIIVLRKGTYLGEFGLTDAHAKQVIAYPDEVAKIDLGFSNPVVARVSTQPAARLEDLDFARVGQYGVMSDPSTAGLVIRHARFIDGREGPVERENPAFIHGWNDQSPASRHRLLVQESYFGPYQMLSLGAFAFTLFDAGDSLVENNVLRTGATTGGIHDKDNGQRNTYRENYIEFSAADANINGIQVSAQSNSEHIHIHHNLFINTGVRLGQQCFQSDCYMRQHDVHFNTFSHGEVTFSPGVFNPTSADTRVSYNIIAGAELAPYAWASCQNPIPSGLSTQLIARGNRLETTASLILRDTECPPPNWPMNLSLQTWRTTYAQDSAASGSVVSTTSDLIGTGATTGLPAQDARRGQLGHLYLRPEAGADALFANGFE